MVIMVQLRFIYGLLSFSVRVSYNETVLLKLTNVLLLYFRKWLTKKFQHEVTYQQC